METITIKIEGKNNVPFFLKLLRKLNFVVDYELNKDKSLQLISLKDAQIDWAENDPSITDFDGIWKERSITLEELREKAWKRI